MKTALQSLGLFLAPVVVALAIVFAAPAIGFSAPLASTTDRTAADASVAEILALDGPASDGPSLLAPMPLTGGFTDDTVVNPDGSIGLVNQAVSISPASAAGNAPLPQAVSSPAIASRGSDIWVLGGQGANFMNLDTVYLGNIGNGSPPTMTSWVALTATLPVPLSHFAGLYANGRVWIFGGDTAPATPGSFDVQLDDAVGNSVYSARVSPDGTLDTWIQDANSLPSAVEADAAAVWKGTFYVVGGYIANYTGPGASNQVACSRLNVDGTLNPWITTTLPIPLYDTSVTAVDDKLYVVGGHTDAGDVNTVYVAPINLDGSLGPWRQEAPLPQKRSAPSFVIANGLATVIGGAWNGAPQSTVYTATVNADGSISPGAWVTTTGTLPVPMAGVATVYSSGRLWMLGGGSSYVYVADSGGGGVTAVDAWNHQTSIAYGTSPDAVGVDTSTGKIYGANSDGSVTVISATTNSFATPITSSSLGSPRAMAINSATNMVYLVNGSGTMSVIDGANDSVSNTISFANNLSVVFPHAVAVNPSTNLVYVADNDNSGGTGTVTVIDGASSSVSANIAVGANPQALAVNSATNEIYVANRNSNSVSVISGTRVITTVAVGTNPQAIAVNPVTNKVYVVDSGSNDVTVIDGSTNLTSTVVPVGAYPYDIGVNSVTNKIYVANYSAGTVTVIDGNTDTASGSPIAVGTNPRALVVNTSANEIYVADSSNYLWVIDGKTNAQTMLGVGTGPFSLALIPGSDNNVFSAEVDTTGPGGAVVSHGLYRSQAQQIASGTDVVSATWASPLTGTVEAQYRDAAGNQTWGDWSALTTTNPLVFNPPVTGTIQYAFRLSASNGQPPASPVLTDVNVITGVVGGGGSNSPDLSSSTKTSGIANPAPGQPFTYTIVLANTGSGNATGAMMTDVLPAQIVYASNSAAASSGAPPSFVPGGSGEVLWNGYVTAGQSVTITFGASVASQTPGGQVITNAATIVDGTGGRYTPSSSITTPAVEAAMTGTVLDPSNNPVGLASVSLYSSLGPPLPPAVQWTSADASGNFTFTNLAPGSYYAIASAPTGVLLANSAPQGAMYDGSTPITLTLRLANAQVIGTVLSSGGISVPNSNIDIRLDGNTSGPPDANAMSNSLGQFAVDGLTPGSTYYLTAHAPLGSTDSDSLPDPVTISGGTSDITMTLRSSAIAGTVYDPSGTTSISNTGVEMYNEYHSIDSWTNTRSDGSFGFPEVPTDTYYIVAHASPQSGYGDSLPYPFYYSGTTQSGITVTLSSPMLTGTVTAPDMQTPVGNSSVSLHSQDYQINTYAPTDQNGRFTLGLVPDTEVPTRTYVLQAFPPMGGGSPYAQSVPRPITVTGGAVVSISEPFTMPLTLPSITGTVYLPNGAPVPYTHVGVHTPDWSVHSDSQTDGSGNFAFGGMISGTNYILEADPQMGTSDYAQTTIPVSVTTGETHYYTITLSTPLLTGVTEQESGVPVPMANVEVQMQGNPAIMSFANSDNNGNFAFGGLADGQYLLSAQAPWQSAGLVAPPSQLITITNGNPVSKTIVFSPAVKHIAGFVKYGNGNLVSDAMVNANNQDGSGWANSMVNPDGSFSLAVAPGTWMVNISPMTTGGPMGPGQSSWTYGQPPSSVSFANDTNPVTDTLTFTVTAAGAQVSGKLVKPDGNPPSQAGVFFHTVTGFGSGGPVNSDGTFDVSLPAGTYIMDVWLPDNSLAAPQVAPIVLGDSSTVNLGTITLIGKTSHISGKVVDANGNGVSGLQVGAGLRSGGTGPGMGPGPGGWAWTTSITDGVYSLDVVSGTWDVSVMPTPNSRYANSGPPQETYVGDNQTVSGINLSVAATDGEVSGSIVDSNNQPLNNLYGFASIDAGAPGMGYGGPINSGTFDIHVPSGVYTVEANLPPGSNYTVAPATNLVVSSTGVTTVTLTASQDSAFIQGNVVDTLGNAITGVAGVNVFAGGPGGQSFSPVDSNSGYYLMAVAPGTYFVNANVDPSTGYSVQPPVDNSVNVSDGMTATFNITVTSANSKIWGIVKDPATQPITNGAWVQATAGGNAGMGRPPYGAQADSSGYYTITVPAGTYNLNAFVPPSRGYLQPLPVTVTVASNSNTPETDLEFRAAAASVSGVVSDSNGVTVTSGLVRGYSDSGARAYANIGADGTYSFSVTTNDTWYIQAVREYSSTVYQSPVYTVTVGSSRVTQDLQLAASGTSMPDSTSTSFDAATMHIVTLSDGTEIDIPAGALAVSGTVTLRATPTGSVATTGSARPIGLAYDLAALDSNNKTIDNFNQPVAIILHYTDAQLAALGITEDQVMASYWDSASGTWLSVPNVVQDKTAKTITIYTTHFSSWTLTGGKALAPGAADLSHSSNASSADYLVPNQPFTYTIVISNTGGGPATGAMMTDPMPSQIVYASNSATATGGSPSYDGSNVLWSGTVTNGQSVTVTFGAAVAPGTAAGQVITNSATILDGAGGIITASNDITVTKATPTVGLTSSPNSSTYGQSVTFTATVTSPAGTPTGVVTFTIDNSDVAAATLSGGAATYVTSTLDAGSYTATVAYGGDSNFNASGSSIATQSVNQARATVTLGPTSFTYDGTSKPITATTSPSVTYSVSYGSGTAPTEAGSYPVTATVTDANYTGSVTGTETILQASSTTTVTVGDATYDGSPHGGTASVTGAGSLSQTLPITYTGRNGTTYGPTTTAPTNAGYYTATATFPGDTDHTGSGDTETYTIAQAAAAVTLGPTSFTYDGTSKPITATTSPSVTYSVSYAGSPTPPTAAGSYPVTATVTDPNYAGTASGTETVNKAGTTITWANPSDIVYGTALGGTQLNATASVTGTFAYSPPAGTVLSAGNSQLITVTFTPTDTVDYNSATATANITVTRATLTVTADGGKSKTYGDAFSALTGNVSGAQNGDSFTATYTSTGAVATAAVGSYTITVASLTPVTGTLANYTEVDDVAANGLTVNNANLSIKANDQAKTYGDTADLGNSDFTPTGLLNGDAVSSVTLTSTGTVSTTTVGSYDIFPSGAGGTGLTNYRVSYVTGTLTVNRANLSIKANDRSKVYGNPVVFAGTEFTSTALLNSDAVTSVTLASDGAPATADVAGSPYSIVPSAAVGSGLGNYNISYANGGLTVTVAAGPIVTPTDRSKVYGSVLSSSSFTGTISGILNGDNITAAYDSVLGDTADATVAGSPYTITAALGGSKLANYAGATVNTGSLTVATAPLTVTANSKTRDYGAANPAFDGTLSGVTAGDTITASYSTTATVTSPVGMYVISPTLNDPGNRLGNYSVTSNDGTLTVSKAAPVITWTNPADIVYGTALGNTQLDATASVPGTFAYTPAVGTVLNVGNSQSLSATFTPTDLTDYATATAAAYINVTKATPLITWTNPSSISYGTALGNTQLDATASVAGTFTYSPAAGTVLNPGSNQALSVTFTPTDIADYTTASATAYITVTAPDLSSSSVVASPAYVAAGDTVTFTITLVNSGSESASASVSDQLPAQLTYVAGSASATVGSVGYSGGTVTWSGNVSVGTPVVVTFRATVNSGVAEGTSIANTAAIGDGKGTTTSKSATVSVLPPPVTTIVPVTGGNVTSSGPTTTTVSLPPDAASTPITVTFTPTSTADIPGGFKAVGNSFVIEATDANGNSLHDFSAHPYTVTVKYSAADVVGLDVSSLKIYSWNTSSNSWVAENTLVDAANHTLTAVINHMSRFTVMASPGFKLFLPIIQRSYTPSGSLSLPIRPSQSPVDRLLALARSALFDVAGWRFAGLP